MVPKTERFELRLDPGVLEKVDAWRSEQEGFPSRAEAVRNLLETGLEQKANSAPVISDGEQLLLHMQCEIYKHLGIEGDIDPKFVQEALWDGHTWALRWRYSGIFHGHVDNSRVLSEVVDILRMWESLERGHAKLPKSEKDRVAAEGGHFGKHIGFPGFDGNFEGEHLSIATFLINKMGRFSSLQGRELNSHAPLLESYGRMLSVFTSIEKTFFHGEMNSQQIINVLKAASV